MKFALLAILASTVDAQVPASLAVRIAMAMEKRPEIVESVTVAATRTGARIEDVPMRVEVLGREEIEEKLLMTPGDIVMMLNEMGGMRVQTTSPGLGAATVRVQGMRGRYTRFFTDGLPLFGEVGGVGLLQIPPMDLGQVEVIKGVASSLYGAGAMGGVVNLVSRQPAETTERELLVNRSSRGATDLVGWYSSPARTGWAWTMLGGGHWQSANDVNGDAWADLAKYSRGVVRPRVFWNDGKGNSFFGTIGFMRETRAGGTIDGHVLPAAGMAYLEAMATRRTDGGFVAQRLINQKYTLSTRAAVSSQRHRHTFGEFFEHDRHGAAFSEVSFRAPVRRGILVVGAAIDHNSYRSTEVSRFDFDHWVPGAFGQLDLQLHPSVLVSGSLRVDHHDQYGTFVSPRASLLLRSEKWSSRISAGTGFLGPTPITEETEAAGLTRLDIPAVLRAETGQSGSIDVTRRTGALTLTFTGFASRVLHALHVERSAGMVMTNLEGPSTNTGVEMLGTFRREPYSVTGTYSYVRSRERAGGAVQDVALTPRHNAGLVGMWEKEDLGRIGFELYFTGRQRLEENPYAKYGRSYVIAGLLGERQIGRYRLFINGENLTGVRQTKWNPLVRSSRAADGRWTVDAWAPLEGRNVNGGVRVRFR